MSENQQLNQLERAVTAFGRFRKRWALLSGLSRFVLLGPGLLLLWVLLDWGVGLPVWPRLILFALFCLAGLVAFAAWFVPPLFRRVDPARETLLIEQLQGKLDNLLIGALQLGREATAKPEGLPHSPLLVQELVNRASQEVERLQPTRLIDLRQTRKLLIVAGAVVVAFVILGLAAPQVLTQRGVRLRDAWRAMLDTLFPVTLTVSPGDLAVVRGSPVTLQVTAQGARRTAIELVTKAAEPAKEQSVPLQLTTKGIPLAAHTIEKAEQTFTYSFVYANRRSKLATILVGDRPEIAAISYELVYPAYVGQAPRTLTGRIPKIQTLAGTSIMVSFAATTELHPSLSYVEWTEGDKQAITVNGRFGHFSFAVDRPNRAVLHLTGKYGKGFEMAEPLSLEIAVDRDQSPTVQVGIRKDKLVMFAEEAMAFAVPYTAEDDYGVAEVALNYRIDTIDAMLGREPRQNSVSRLVEPIAERVTGRFADVFKSLNPALQPGDRIRIELVAKDNNTETGPGTGRSRTLEIVVVRPDLAQFTEKEFGFQETALLGGLKRVERVTNLLIEPEKTVRAEKEQAFEKQKVDARLNSEPWPSGAADAVGDYFRLLSGGK